MKTNLSSAAPSQLETDCLVVITLDKGEKDKPAPSVESADNAVREAAKDVIVSGEVTAKPFEATLLHHPAGLKAKRLLLLGGGKAKNLSTAELRKLAGAAVRTLKAKNIRSFAFVAGVGGNSFDAVRAIVEGAFVGDFDPGYYKSDRKDKDGDQKIDAITLVVEGDTKPLEVALQAGRIIAESQNFTRDLVNEPSNLMTPTILADRAKKMASEVGLACETYGA
ncbi:MAG TPA: M17 family peptidase N-terminal domain-containing protein, partial [Terriglobales bacterium]|nr:M17 family peptidase N-terminal domain-containing protein [Terriglobales bacterium]